MSVGSQEASAKHYALMVVCNTHCAQSVAFGKYSNHALNNAKDIIALRKKQVSFHTQRTIDLLMSPRLSAALALLIFRLFHSIHENEIGWHSFYNEKH